MDTNLPYNPVSDVHPNQRDKVMSAIDTQKVPDVVFKTRVRDGSTDADISNFFI